MSKRMPERSKSPEGPAAPFRHLPEDLRHLSAVEISQHVIAASPEEKRRILMAVESIDATEKESREYRALNGDFYFSGPFFVLGGTQVLTPKGILVAEFLAERSANGCGVGMFVNGDRVGGGLEVKPSGFLGMHISSTDEEIIERAEMAARIHVMAFEGNVRLGWEKPRVMGIKRIDETDSQALKEWGKRFGDGAVYRCDVQRQRDQRETA